MLSEKCTCALGLCGLLSRFGLPKLLANPKGACAIIMVATRGEQDMLSNIKRPRRAALQSVVFAGLLVAGLGTLVTPALAGWDAIAVDDDTSTKGGDAGYGVGSGNTKAAAEADAMKNCKSEGNTGCAVEVSYKDMCGAYASSKKYSGHGTGMTKEAASKAALSSCGDAHCKIVATDCDGD